ncbi:MAG TPA: hypothetical protein PLW42_09495, partial [Anaerohalosphaeraceae bacterium]|nr:hypothetical protein [Anaerohalosphaeraceae bacterium]
PGQNPSRPRKRKAAPADGSKIRLSIRFSAIPPKPPQQPFSTGSKMRADASAGSKSGFKMRAAVFKWL